MRELACILLLAAMLALQPQVITVPLSMNRPPVVRMLLPVDPPAPRRLRRRNHYRR